MGVLTIYPVLVMWRKAPARGPQSAASE